MADQLNSIEVYELRRHETVIERGLQTFYDVGRALMEIRDKKLYRGQYDTFEDYCLDRWGMADRRARQFIDAAEVVDNLSKTGTIVPPPNNEAQARPLVTLSPAQQIDAWQRAVDTAPDGRVTMSHVQQVVNEIRQPVEQGNGRPFDYKRDAKAQRAADEYVPQGYDACQTPAYAIDPLLPYLRADWTVWEPAQGEGLLLEALFDSSLTAVGSDILTGQNFFEYQPEAWDCIVTNPPFSLKYKWLERCYDLGKSFALLLPVETLGAKTAHEMFRQYGIEVVFMDRRVNFKMPNKGWDGAGAQFPVAWFTWGLSIGQQMTFARLTSGDNE